MVRADLLSMRARYEIDAWMAGGAGWTLPEWKNARDALLQARAITPDDPLLYDYLGVLDVLRGQMGWRAEGIRKVYFGEALGYQKESLRLRWHNGAAWANLALSEYALDDHKAALEAAERAIEYGPNEVRVRSLVSELTLAMWSQAPVNMKTWVQQNHLRAQSDELKMFVDLERRYGVDVMRGGLLPTDKKQP